MNIWFLDCEDLSLLCQCKLSILSFGLLVRQNKQFEDVNLLSNYDGHANILYIGISAFCRCIGTRVYVAQ